MPKKITDADETPTLEMAAPSAPAAVKKAVEVWAEAKGLYPQVFESPMMAIPSSASAGGFGTVAIDMRPLKAPVPNESFWKFAAAKTLRRWPIGKEVTEAEFDEAVQSATTQS